MTKEEATTVKVGNNLFLTDWSDTPNRKFNFPLQQKMPVNILEVITEKNGSQHFDIGFTLPEGENPLLSRDTGEEIDGSNVYWMHPSRFSNF